MPRLRQVLVLLLLNAALAATIQQLPQAPPTLTDRDKYEHVGRNPLSPSCLGGNLYCYRVLVPALLEQIPVDSDRRWRVQRWVGVTTAGAITAMAVWSTAGTPGAVVASILAQGSYGFAFTAYDPYGVDPTVFLLLALLAWCWQHDRWAIAAVIAVAGIFIKETLAVMSVGLAIAALIGPRRSTWKLWLSQGIGVVVLAALYRWVMQTYVGWAMPPAASLVQNDLVAGGWIVLWLEANSPATQAFLLFVTFAFAWVYAALAFRDAPPLWRNLALGSAVPFLALNYVQNPERALGNIFFVVVPLASFALARVPAAVAVLAALVSAMISTRAATGTTWLPAVKYLLPLGIATAAAVIWYRRGENGAGKRA